MATAVQMASRITHRCHIAHPLTPHPIPMFTLCLPFYSVILPIRSIFYTSVTLFPFNHTSIHVAAIWAGRHPVVNAPDPLQPAQTPSGKPHLSQEPSGS